MILLEILAKIKDIISSLRLTECVIQRPRVIAIVKGAIKAENLSLLTECGGDIMLTDQRVSTLLTNMNCVRHKETMSKLPVVPALVRDFKKKIATAVNQYNIAKELVLNFDQTPLAYKSPGSYTMAPLGSKKVPVHDADEKAAITGTVAVSAAGTALPMQLSYHRKTIRCLPKHVEFPSGFDLNFNEKHWANEGTSFELVERIILPHIKKVKEQNNMTESTKSLLILDVFRGQKTEAFLKYLEANNIYIFVPANMTDIFQHMDISVNKRIKAVIRGCYNNWYSNQVLEALSAGVAPTEVKVKQPLSVIKPLHAKWLISAYNDLCSPPGE